MSIVEPTAKLENTVNNNCLHTVKIIVSTWYPCHLLEILPQIYTSYTSVLRETSFQVMPLFVRTSVMREGSASVRTTVRRHFSDEVCICQENCQVSLQMSGGATSSSSQALMIKKKPVRGTWKLTGTDS